MTETENRASEAAEDVRQLPTESLHPNDYNPNRMTDEEFAELLEEVRFLGRLPKPVVVRNGYACSKAGSYLIVDGEHGWRAAKEVGLAEITCEVIEADDFEAMRQTYKRNQHGTHDRAALGEMFKRMREERDISNRELANEINVSEGTIRNALVFAEAAEMRRRFSPEKGATKDDYRFSTMTTKQARDYVSLPGDLRDRWLEAGAKPIWNPDTWGMPDEGVADLEGYLQLVVESGLVKVLKRGSFDENMKTIYDLMKWRSRHRYLLGDKIDAYIRPVVEMHSVSPPPVQFLEWMPMQGGNPVLSPEEWAEALHSAWEHGEKVHDVLGLIRSSAQLKAAQTGVENTQFEHPRTALIKFEVERDAPIFIKEADIPLYDKHFLTCVGTGDGPIWSDREGQISTKEIEDLKRSIVRVLAEGHKKYREQRKVYEAWLKDADLGQLAASFRGEGGGQPPHPRGVKRAQDMWDGVLRDYLDRRDKVTQQSELKKIFADPEKVVEAMVERFHTAAPKVFGQEVGDKVASEVLRERLKSMPEPEMLLLGAVMLKAPVTVWLEAVREEVEN
jgi:ParB/RepB/Spo0J family partition protein